jgi:hypothetical protein
MGLDHLPLEAEHSNPTRPGVAGVDLVTVAAHARLLRGRNPPSIQSPAKRITVYGQVRANGERLKVWLLRLVYRGLYFWCVG